MLCILTNVFKLFKVSMINRQLIVFKSIGEREKLRLKRKIEILEEFENFGTKGYKKK